MDLVKKLEHDVGLIEVVVRNVGANIHLPNRGTTVWYDCKVLEMVALSAFLWGMTSWIEPRRYRLREG